MIFFLVFGIESLINSKNSTTGIVLTLIGGAFFLVHIVLTIVVIIHRKNAKKSLILDSESTGKTEDSL